MRSWDEDTITLIEKLLREKSFDQAVSIFAEVDLPMTSQSDRLKGSLVDHINHYFRECRTRNGLMSFYEKCIDVSKGYSVELAELLNFVAITQNIEVSLSESPLIQDFKAYYSVSEHQLEAAVDLSKSAIRPDYLSVIHEEMIAALRNHTGYSYVRVGDGEGRFLSSLTAFPTIWSRSVETAKRVWFWTSDYPEDGFFDMLREAVVHASSVGISPEFRLRFEARNSLLGYVGCVSGNKFVCSGSPLHSPTTSRIFPNWTNVELDRLGYFDSIVADAPRVVLVTCYPDDLIQARFGEMFQKRVLNIQVPAENHANLLGLSLRSKHYPDMFYRTLTLLDDLEPGTLVLVGAGVYGKIYCDFVRKRSSCAVDIGSVVDGWMGVKTR